MTPPLKIALIGAGRMAAIYADIVADRPDTELVGVVGRSSETTQKFSQRYKIKGYPHGAWSDLIRERPDTDAYILTTPEWVRVEPLMEILKTKRPVLVEKPIAASPEAAVALKKLAPEDKARITVAHSLRFSPRFSQAGAVIEAGEIGDIRHIASRRNPSRDSVKRVLGKFGLGYWLSAHDIDLMRWFIKSEVASVTAMSRHGLTSDDDYLLVHLKFENGVDAVHEVSWCSPPLSDLAPACAMTIKGTQGLIDIDDSSTGVSVYRSDHRLTSPDTYEAFTVGGVRDGLFAALIERWVRSVRGSAPAYPSFDEAMKAVDVCTAIMTSVRSGKTEHLNP